MAQNAADILVETLLEWGVETIFFGLPGDGTWGWADRPVLETQDG